MALLLPTNPPASLGLALNTTPLDLLYHLQNPGWNSHFCISFLEAEQSPTTAFPLHHKNIVDEEVKDQLLSRRPGQPAIFLRLSGPALSNTAVYKAPL